MNMLRTFVIACTVSLVAACSTTPSKPAAPAAPPAASAMNLSGNWILTVESQMGSQDMKMTVKQTGTNLAGTMESPMGSVDYTGTLTGKDVKMGFNFNAQGTDLHIDYIGTTDGTTMSGKAIFGTFGEGTFKAKRQ
jgi:hypothetical protein